MSASVSVRFLSSQTKELVHTLHRGCGLGDTILLLGAAVHFGRKLGHVRLVASPSYHKSVSDLLVNHPEVESIIDGPEKLLGPNGEAIIHELEGPPPNWYQNIGIPFSERWDSCPVSEVTRSIEPSGIAPVFVHDGPSMGYHIPVKGYRPPPSPSIIDHVHALKGAREIHCMDSAFFNLIESMDPLAADLFYYPNVKGHHLYDRKRHFWNVVS